MKISIFVFMMLLFIGCDKGSKSTSDNRSALKPSDPPSQRPQNPVPRVEPLDLSCEDAKKLMTTLNQKTIEISRSNLGLDSNSKDFQFQLGTSLGLFLEKEPKIKIGREILLTEIVSNYNTFLIDSYNIRSQIKTGSESAEHTFINDSVVKMRTVFENLTKKPMRCFDLNMN